MIRTTIDYADLVPGGHRDLPKFRQVVQLLTEVSARTQQFYASIPRLFDLDQALGDQLDVIGLWVGIGRVIPVEVSGVYFEWDGGDALGWDAGIWQGPFDPDAGPVLLNDDDYRRLIRTKIRINTWDGSLGELEAIWQGLLPDGRPGIVLDNQDMTLSFGFEGTPITGLQLAILNIGLALIKPAAVRILDVFSATAGEPLFAWDSGPGWDNSSWSTLLN